MKDLASELAQVKTVAIAGHVRPEIRRYLHGHNRSHGIDPRIFDFPADNIAQLP